MLKGDQAMNVCPNCGKKIDAKNAEMIILSCSCAIQCQCKYLILEENLSDETLNKLYWS